MRGGGIKAEYIRQTVCADKSIYDLIKARYPEAAEYVLEWIIQDNMGWFGVLKQMGDKQECGKMKRDMRKLRAAGLFNKRTYWKTRAAYFLGMF